MKKRLHAFKLAKGLRKATVAALKCPIIIANSVCPPAYKRRVSAFFVAVSAELSSVAVAYNGFFCDKTENASGNFSKRIFIALTKLSSKFVRFSIKFQVFVIHLNPFLLGVEHDGKYSDYLSVVGALKVLKLYCVSNINKTLNHLRKLANGSI